MTYKIFSSRSINDTRTSCISLLLWKYLTYNMYVVEYHIAPKEGIGALDWCWWRSATFWSKKMLHIGAHRASLTSGLSLSRAAHNTPASFVPRSLHRKASGDLSPVCVWVTLTLCVVQLGSGGTARPRWTIVLFEEIVLCRVNILANLIQHFTSQYWKP